MRKIFLLIHLNFLLMAQPLMIYIPASETKQLTNSELSSENAKILTELQERGLKISNLTDINAYLTPREMICRGWFPIVAPNAETFGTLITNTLKNELSKSKILYYPEGSKLSVEKIDIDFNTMGQSNWTYNMTLSNGKKTERFSYTHEFGYFFAAVCVCQAVKENFPIGLERFLHSIYEDPRFAGMIDSNQDMNTTVK